MHPLTVYKASAGSGKTFTLAVEYISLLVRKPDAYREILAVTFTNKATAEMKNRILSQLYGIAINSSSSQTYLEAIKKTTGIDDEDVIRTRTRKALALLLHHYQDFQVQTIDTFFQRVLRNLARELDLSANLRVSLNDKEVEDTAVDDMIQNLSIDSKELKWISDYINTNIDDNKSWNVIGQIKEFGNNIFRDFYKESRREIDAKLSMPTFFPDFTSKLIKQREIAKKNIIEPAQRIINILEDNGLADALLFPYGYKGSIFMTIKRVADGNFDGSPTGKRIQSAIDDPKKWAKKGTSEAQKLTSLAEARLCRMLGEMEEARHDNWNRYQSARLTLRHLSQLRLLRSIGNAVDSLNHDAGRFPLSETQTLLSGIIEGQDAPFIYEKIGAKLKHIMIDEFQDTSTVQWNNFKILLADCISQQGSHDLIVGDVKQSIYRWRGGDWKIINNLALKDKTGTPSSSKYNGGISSDNIDVMTLSKNYRSEKRIVKFNNTFFTHAVEYECNRLANDGLTEERTSQLSTAYDDVCQETTKKETRGSVTIKLLPSLDYRNNVLSETLDAVIDMLNHRISADDIAILVRVNKDIPDIANAFANDERLKDVRLVSDEAFRLDSSQAVNIIITALRLIAHNDDEVARAELVRTYHKYILHDDTIATQLIMSREQMDAALPHDFITEIDKLAAMPFVDLVNKLEVLFSLHTLEDQSAYLCSFHDCIAEYLDDSTADIEEFLNTWDDTLHEKTIQGDEISGIRLISIHKSKGLEFKNVIIPFCDWKMELLSTIWCSTKGKGEPYDELPVIPVDYSRGAMQGTVYEEDYQEEHLQNTVDNLNLLYVAFTRAGSNLVVIGKRAGEKSKANGSNRSEVIEAILPGIANELGATIENEDDKKSPLVFTYGELAVDSKKDSGEKTTDNVFELHPTAERVIAETFDYPASFRQSNESRNFINGDDVNDNDRGRYIKMGNVMHEIFSHIKTAEDIMPQLRQMVQDGVLYSDDFTPSDLQKAILKALGNETVKEWFAPGWELFNECTILQYDEASGMTVERRPDRVMKKGDGWIVVDFKFGQSNDKVYSRQVATYMNLIRQMGARNIKGYIWYVMKDKVVEVKD